jgi:predicted transposase
MLIQMASLGNGGHSYGILINDKQFNFDGDGSDHISSINDITLNKKVYSDINKQIDIYNKALNNDKNMNEDKKQIKLTESEFKQLVSESVKSVINEISKSGLKKKWINKIYKVITPLTSHIYIDEAWQNAKYVLRVIDELLDESALEVLLKAPFYRLNVTSATVTAKEEYKGSKIGTITLPTDFLRLVSFSMSDWQQPVTSFAIQGDEIAKKQANKYLRGGVAKPVAVLSKNSSGYSATYYSTNAETHSVTEFLYIKKADATEVSDSQLIDAMVWICAGKTLGVLNESNLSALCYENAKGLMV